MSNPETPAFLVVEVPDLVAARSAFTAMGTTVESSGGTLLAAALPRDVQVLEAGTALGAVLIARWSSREAALRYWQTPQIQQAFAPARAITGACAVLVKGVPAAGLPGDFLPTVATVTAPTLATPPAYMLVQGSVTNLEPIERYVAIIMPMLRERRGYYVVYAQAPDVEVLHGSWAEQAFIISRWPTLAAARNFWDCQRYQEEAIPIRTGHGQFSVSLLPGLAG